jgi:hypothetical protein
MTDQLQPEPEEASLLVDNRSRDEVEPSGITAAEDLASAAQGRIRR